jgi:hypothetical protein
MNYPENILKYAGVIKQNIDKCYYSYSYQNKELNIYEKKKFPYFDEPSRQLAYQSALQYKIDYSIQHNLVLNHYTQECDENENQYLKVSLNVPNTFLLVDLKDKSLIENFDWRIQNNSKYATCYMNENEFQKFNSYLTSIKNESQNDQIKYVYENMLQNLQNKDTSTQSITEKKRHYIPFHLLKYGLDHVDFINKNKLDNRDFNIGSLTKSQHAWKSQVGDAKLRSNNSSGKAGVFYGKCGNYDYWEVRGKDYFGNKIYRKFSINKHGYEGSKHMAVHFRDLIIDKSYKPHQLDEIYTQVIHHFENYQEKYDLENKVNVQLLDEDDSTIVSKVESSISKMLLNDEDDEFIFIEKSD